MAAAKQQQNNAANNAAKQQLALQRARAAEANREYQARAKEQQQLLKERERENFDRRPQGRTGDVWRDRSAPAEIESNQRNAPVTSIQPPANSR
jgi:hypothetical protein